MGRTIRKSGKLKPIIYTLYTTEDEYLKLYEEQFNNPYIDVKWRGSLAWSSFDFSNETEFEKILLKKDILKILDLWP